MPEWAMHGVGEVLPFDKRTIRGLQRALAAKRLINE
jgi:hypothetical protein